QHHRTAVFVVQEAALEPAGAVDTFINREYRHVAGALRDRRDEFASRLPAVVVGYVPADAVGLGHVHRHDRVLLYAPVSVYSLPADDLDFRDAPPLYGVMAEFENPTDLVAAAQKVYSLGYRRINGYSPYPIEELSEAIGFTKTSLPLIVFIGGLIGGLSGFFMQYWIEVIDYPINVGGKPY